MKKFHSNSVKALAFSASAIAFAVAGPAFAQDAEEAQEEEVVDITEDGEQAVQPQGGITVTGSRIRRDTYTSISPLQVITTDNSQNVGAFDPAQILQRSESASGTQIDATFLGFVLDNGPGSQTLNLRGLGADRTLLLVNGRRLAPAGVEGAPSAPSINLLPSSLIDRFDLLTDGASSIYGSDAVAGVGNVILRKDFDGLELFASGNANPQGGGDDYTVSAAWGFNTDRAFFGIGAEYDYRDEIRRRDRDFLRGCDTDYEITDTGEIRTVGFDDQINTLLTSGGTITTGASPCKRTGLSGRIFIPFTNLGSVYYVGVGNENTNIPGYSESANAFGVPIDADGDGFQDIDFQDFNTNGANLDSLLIPAQKRYSVMAYGEYTFPGEGNITPFFEFNYVRADIESQNTGELQIFPSVPASNPFNPCNLTTGVDCPQADNDLQGGPFNPNVGFSLPAVPLFAIRGDRDNFDLTQEQYRGVLGVKGDLPFIGSSWTFELAGIYSRSEGTSVRRGIREDKLAFAIGIDPTADFDGDGVVDNNGDGLADDYDFNVNFFSGTPCNANALANPSLAMPDLLDGCVPANLFAPSVLGTLVGDFETAAERDYLFGVRSFDTTYEQTILSGFVQGDLFDLPAGPVGAVFGVEYRKDEIDSRPNEVASNGLLFGFFADRGAVGSKDLKELFAEINIPLQADKPWVRELNLNASGRMTDEEFYGTNWTYAVKADWRPIEQLQLKVTYGTSFRAPNLRENFLQGQSGFPTVVDPCAVPDAAFNSQAGGYNAALDTREQTTLDNCIREGRDPTSVGIDAQGLNTVQITSAEATSGGSLDLDPETSRSITAGFAFEETFFDGFDVALNVNYYDVKLKQSIIEPSSQFIINDCFTRQDGLRSQFCDRISYGSSPASRFLISDINSGFINLNQESVRGFDFNATFGKDVTMFGKVIDLGLELRANRLVERSNIFIDDSGVESFDEDAGEFGFPKWTGRATFTAEIDNFLFSWQARYIGDMEQAASGIDPLADNFGFSPDGVQTGFFGDTCTGFGSNGPGGAANPIVAGDGVFCRDIGFANDYFVHSASIRYRDDSWTFRLGVTNIFDRDPPLVDSNEVFAISNTPVGNGYDLDGREFFFTVQKAF